jgi:uncharacterized protein YjbJ (UPF0337 family)
MRLGTFIALTELGCASRTPISTSKEASMNEHTVKGAWREIKGEIQQMWGKLTGEELDRAEGNIGSVAGMIQQKYGQNKDEVSSKLDEIVRKYDSTPKEGTRTTMEKIADATEDFKEGVKHRM